MFSSLVFTFLISLRAFRAAILASYAFLILVKIILASFLFSFKKKENFSEKNSSIASRASGVPNLSLV